MDFIYYALAPRVRSLVGGGIQRGDKKRMKIIKTPYFPRLDDSITSRVVFSAGLRRLCK